MDGYLDLVQVFFHKILLIDWRLFLLRLLLAKYGRYVCCCPNNMNMSSVGDTIGHRVLIIIPILWFVIAQASVLGVFLVNFDDTNLDEPLLESIPFSLMSLYVRKQFITM